MANHKMLTKNKNKDENYIIEIKSNVGSDVKPKRLDFFEDQSAKTAASTLNKDRDELFCG